jgi:hypothetical protein
MKSHEILRDDRTGRWSILHHPALRGLTFHSRRDAVRFLIRVRNAETELESAMREAVESVREEVR